jgi:sigma-B regulation protein RsbU (phosphoserine phosphatase)
MTPQTAAVLVVDDVAENRDLLVRRLKRLGIGDVEEAENGVAALAALARRNFDLVLLDIMMPEMNGYQVLEHLKQNGRMHDLPIIVISALNEIDPVVRCIELGAEDFVFKPFNPTLLRARVMATLEKKALRDATREELRRKQVELAEARTLQLALAPPPFRGAVGGRPLTIDLILEPAKEVGGDIVDHFCIGDDRLVLVLGDVSDKGAGAALMMARTHALFRALAGRPDAASIFGAPEKAVRLVNATLSAGNAHCMFVTLLIAVFDASAGRLTYVRAGHIPPFLRRAGGGMIERLGAAGGPPLGLVEDAGYKSAVVDLGAGDEFLSITDGITEAADPAKALFGDARVAEWFARGDAGAPASLTELLSQVRAFEAGSPASDDIAAILLRLGAG